MTHSRLVDNEPRILTIGRHIYFCVLAFWVMAITGAVLMAISFLSSSHYELHTGNPTMSTPHIQHIPVHLDYMIAQDIRYDVDSDRKYNRKEHVNTKARLSYESPIS